MQLPSLTTILVTVVIILTIRFILKYFILPYIKLMRYKNFKGGHFLYKPLLGEFIDLQADLNAHGDLYASTIKRIEENPNIRAIFFPFLATVRVNLYDPELIKEFFSKTAKFIKDPVMFAPMSRMLKSGLVFSEGEKWKSQRKLISQVFHFDYINACLPIINLKCLEWLDTYCKNESKVTVDVKKTLKMYTSKTVWRIFFGEEEIDSEAETERLIEMMLDNASIERCYSLLNLFFGPKIFDLGLRAVDRKYNHEARLIENFARKKLNYFKEKLAKEQDSPSDKHSRNLIERLLIEASKQEEGGETVSDFEIMNQIMTFLVAGTDTTMNLLMLSQYHLAFYPEVQKKLREEIMQHVGKTGEITYEKLLKLDYLTAILKETLRLYGPADVTFPRTAIEDVMLGDLVVRKGDMVSATFKIVHSNPKYFTNPREFRPERWIEKTDPGVKDPFSFTPFAAGARRCIGEQLAYIEAKIMVVELVRRYHIDIQRPFQLRMGYGLVYENGEPMIGIYTKL